MVKLNILNLATTDDGGAGVASLYLNELFNRAGHQSQLVVKESKLTNNQVIVLGKTHSGFLHWFFWKVRNRIKLLINKNNKKIFDPRYCFYPVNNSFISAREILAVLPGKPDVILLHWISDFLNPKAIKKIKEKTQAKILWLMLDNSPLTGGCHYPWECKGFHSDCSNCPAIMDRAKKNIAGKHLKLKSRFLPKEMELIACTEFDFLRAVNASAFMGKKIHKILLPIDDTRYLPADKDLAKQFFGIDPGKKVIFYGSLSLGDLRKGGRYFLESLAFFCNTIRLGGGLPDEYLVLLAGEVAAEVFNRINLPVMQTGYLKEDELIKAYQAADVFVSSSIEDSGPLMINQSVMCGTPVVSFEMGVALDLVITGTTGYRAKLRDSGDLARGIQYILELGDTEYQAMRNNCRDLALRLCQPGRQAARFTEVFEEGN